MASITINVGDWIRVTKSKPPHNAHPRAGWVGKVVEGPSVYHATRWVVDFGGQGKWSYYNGFYTEYIHQEYLEKLENPDEAELLMLANLEINGG